MSIALVCLDCILSLHTASDVALSVCSGVEGCLWPISINTILIYTASRFMMYSATNSALVADVMTCLMMCAMLSTAPLLAGIVALFCSSACLWFTEIVGITVYC